MKSDVFDSFLMDFDLFSIKTVNKKIKMVEIHQKLQNPSKNLMNFDHIWLILIKIILFSMNFERFNWIQFWFNQICQVGFKSDEEFGSKIQLKSKIITTFLNPSPKWFNCLSLITRPGYSDLTQATNENCQWYMGD